MMKQYRSSSGPDCEHSWLSGFPASAATWLPAQWPCIFSITQSSHSAGWMACQVKPLPLPMAFG